MLIRSTRNQNWLPEVFNTLFDNDFAMPRVAATTPAINVIEREHEYAVEIAAPGMTREDFHVTLDADDNLVVDLEKKASTEQKPEEQADKNDNTVKSCQCHDHYLRREFTYTRFHQTLLLPDDVDRDKITANVKDGILNVTLPKLTPEAQKRDARVIEIG
ncbi:MAG: Hsp20/alpha crystallin family protein [Muribaculaceae bacterium]|nr:Hsp20/alpha crystallin family protein [Muribaculaceae bacterium]